MAAPVPPWDREAEEETLGAYIFDPEIRSKIDFAPDDFFDPAHREVARALKSMSERDLEIDAITLKNELNRRGKLDVDAGRLVADLIHLREGAKATERHARLVKEHALARAIIRDASSIGELASNGRDTSALVEAGQELSDNISALMRQTEPVAQRDRATDGGSFAFDTPETPIALWGDGGRILWASGEALILAGPSGVGKTSIVQQVVLGRLGMRAEILGLPVLPAPSKILYVAADRPRQAARSFARMVTDEDRSTLEEGLVVWPGPLPFDLAQNPEKFVPFIQRLGAMTVVIDSLKDVALDLSKDETGARVNHAIQTALAADIEVLVLHHQRKAQVGGGKPRKIDDVFGSVWLTAGAGSVILLWGEPGDLVIELSHLKQPAEPIGPLKILHDHATGHSSVLEGFDPLGYVRKRATGATAQEVAAAISDASVPGRNDVEKARRKLDALVRKGLLHRQEGSRGGRADNRNPARYFAVTRQEDPS